MHKHCMHDHLPALQGLVAGLNAARRAQELEPVVVPRNTSYIGTLIDDLVTKVQTQTHCMVIPHLSPEYEAENVHESTLLDQMTCYASLCYAVLLCLS